MSTQLGIVINGAQSYALAEVFQQYSDDSPVFITGSDIEDRPVTFGFSMATVTIEPNGDYEAN